MLHEISVNKFNCKNYKNLCKVIINIFTLCYRVSVHETGVNLVSEAHYIVGSGKYTLS